MFSVNGTSVIRQIQPVSSSPVASINDLPASPIPNSNHLIDHFPLDKNLAHLHANKIFDSTHRISPSADLSSIDLSLPASRRDYLHDFLFKERKLILKGRKGTIVLNISLAKLIKFFDGQNRIVGGFAKYIFGSAWFGNIAEVLKLPDQDSRFFKKLLKDFDSEEIDIDLQHIHNELERELLYIKFVQFVAKCTLPPHASEEQVKKAYDDITQGGSFKDISSFFYVENGEVAGDANRISLKFEGMKQVDLLIGRIISRGFIASVQDFHLVVDSLLNNSFEKASDCTLTATGETQRGLQAVLDCLCKTYQFEKCDALGWARTLLYNSQMSRYPGIIPPEIYDNLQKKCSEEKSVANTLHYTVQLVSKHKQNPQILLSLTYNACADLIKHGFSSEDLNKFSHKMLREEIYPEGPLKALQKALLNLPFEITAALIELIGILKLTSKNNEGLYLTQHDGALCLMTFINEFTLLQAINPEKAIQRLSNYTFNQEGLLILGDLCKHFQLTREYKRDFESAIDQYGTHLRWNWEALTLQLIPLMNKSKELDLIVDLFWFLCTGSTRNPQYRSLDTVAGLFRNWTPLDSLNGCKLWDIFTQEMNEKELLAFADSVIAKTVHPKLALHLLKDLMRKAVDPYDIVRLLKPIACCAVNRQMEDLLPFLECIMQLQKKSENLNVLCQNFLRYWIEDELKFHRERGKDLLELCVRNHHLPIAKDLAHLWLAAIETFFEKKEMETALELWKSGDDYGFWREGAFQKSHRGFLVAFAEGLFRLEKTEGDAAVFTILDYLPEAKDFHKSQVDALKLERDTRLKDIRQTQAALKKSISSFEAVLKSNPNDKANHLRTATNIFQSLSQNLLNHQDNLSNLTEAKLLLANPRVISLFDSCPSVYLSFILQFLERSEKMLKSRRIDSTLIHALLELYLRHLPPAETPALLVILLFTEQTKDEIPRGLKDEAVQKVDRMIEVLKHLKRMKELCLILDWHGNAMPISQRTDLALWILQETSADISRQEACYGLTYLMSHQNLYPFDCAHSQQLSCFLKLAAHMLASEQTAAARPWIEKAITLATRTVLDDKADVEKQLLEWCKNDKHSPDLQLIAPFFEAIYERRPDLRLDLMTFFNDDEGKLISAKPHLYVKLLHSCGAHALTPAVYVKINSIIRKLLKEAREPKANLSVCLSFFEREYEISNALFSPVLKAVIKIDDQTLKLRALSIATSRVALNNLRNILEDAEQLNDRMQSLLAMIALIDQLRKDNAPLDYSKISLILSSLICDTNDPSIPPQNRLLPPKVLPEMVYSPIRVMREKGVKDVHVFVKEILRLNIETLQMFNEDPAKYQMIAENIVQIIGMHDDLIESEEESFKLMFKMLLGFAVSNIPEVFHSGVVHLADEFEGNIPERLKMLTDVFDLYLNRLDKFSNNKETLDKVTKLSAWLSFHLPLQYQEKLYPTLLKLYSRFPECGDCLLPSKLLQNFKYTHLLLHLARYFFLETPNGILFFAVLYFYLKRNTLNGNDILFWGMVFAMWNKVIKPRYAEREIHTSRPSPSLPGGVVPIFEPD